MKLLSPNFLNSFMKKSINKFIKKLIKFLRLAVKIMNYLKLRKIRLKLTKNQKMMEVQYKNLNKIMKRGNLESQTVNMLKVKKKRNYQSKKFFN